MISYRARRDVPVALVVLVSGLLVAGRREIGPENTRGLGLLPAGAAAGLEQSLAEGTHYVILDGTLIRATAAGRKPLAAGISRKSMPAMNPQATASAPQSRNRGRTGARRQRPSRNILLRSASAAYALLRTPATKTFH